MTEVWAYCEQCCRWFYCPHGFDRGQPQPVCPVCATEPTLIRNVEPGRSPERV